MKKFLFILMSLVLMSNASAQTKFTDAERDSVLLEVLNRLNNIEYKIEPPQRYKLYKTENIYTFLKLDTKTGIIRLIQWNLDTDKEFETLLNSEDLTTLISEIGQFELIPTSNMYQFLLLDKIRGYVWHVQWGAEYSNRWIRRIY